MGGVHAEIEHLLKESNIRNPGYFVFANTPMLLCWRHYMFMGRKCLRKRNNLDLFCYLYSINFQFLHCQSLSMSQYNKKYRRKLEFFISTSGGIALCVYHSILRVYQLCFCYSLFRNGRTCRMHILAPFT